MRQKKVVVVEDEGAIATAVAERLRSEGFEVEIAHDGPGAVELCKTARPDLVVLDIMLPGFDGVEVCRRIQAERQVPVLMLTARDSETDVLIGLGVGADDYMTKPFSPRELVARVKAILRRLDRSAALSAEAPLQVGDIVIDAGKRTVVARGDIVHLTPIEFDLLHHLARRPGHVHPREQLLSEVWGYDNPAGERTVDSHIRTLRKKLGPSLIRTVHGVGYSVEQP